MNIQKITALITGSPHPPALIFYPEPGDPRHDRMTDVVRALQTAGLTVTVASDVVAEDLERPALALGTRGDYRHLYQALPEGPEGPPFEDLIRSLAAGESALSSDTLQILADLAAPLDIKVLITGACPYCPKMVTLANRMAAFSRNIRTRIVDTGLFPEWIDRYRPKAAPTTILNDEVFLTGVHTEAELTDWIRRLTSTDYLAQLYRNDLLEKRFSAGTARLRKNPQHLSILAGLLRAEEFGIKLGAMALLEELIDTAPGLQERILMALAPLVSDSPDPVAGDAAFLIGRLRDPGKQAVLAPLLNHPNPEIAEIAREGLGG